MYHTRAFVLGHTEKGEADFSYSLYTERFGLIRATAQGVRKISAKLKGHLELFGETEISLVSGKGGYRLIGAVLVDPHRSIALSLEKQRAASAMAAILGSVAFEGEDLTVWQILRSVFQLLGRDEPRSHDGCRQVLLWFSVKLLAALGYTLSRDPASLLDGKMRELVENYEKAPVPPADSAPPSNEEYQRLMKAVSRSFENHLGCSFSFLTDET